MITCIKFVSFAVKFRLILRLFSNIINFFQVDENEESKDDEGEEDKESSLLHPPHSVISNGISILLALLETRTAVIVNSYNANQNEEFGNNFFL